MCTVGYNDNPVIERRDPERSTVVLQGWLVWSISGKNNGACLLVSFSYYICRVASCDELDTSPPRTKPTT